jgi:hypothetical protein
MRAAMTPPRAAPLEKKEWGVSVYAVRCGSRGGQGCLPLGSPSLDPTLRVWEPTPQTRISKLR